MSEGSPAHAFEFVYVADPMCSWCWGFAPTIEQLGAGFNIPIRIVVGGLRPAETAEKLDDRMRSYLEQTWELVAARSGQPFDTSFLARNDGWVYDTELPAMAVVTMRRLRPDAEAAFFTGLQRAFYAQAIDITDPDEYPALVAEFLDDAEEFLDAFTSDEARWAAWNDFSTARSWGVDGFPALLLQDGDDLSVVTRGFQPATTLVPAVADFFVNRRPSEGVICTIDGYC